MPLPYKPTEKDGRAVADHNDLKVLKAIRLFGHLRRQEVAMAAWPGYVKPQCVHHGVPDRIPFAQETDT